MNAPSRRTQRTRCARRSPASTRSSPSPCARQTPPHRPRLQRVRTAAERLQRVVVALLAMFRSGAEVQRSEIDVGALAARLPIEGLVMEARGTTPLNADADLLTAAVLNLLDNAQRHGARSVTFSTPAAERAARARRRAGGRSGRGVASCAPRSMRRTTPAAPASA